MNVFWHGHQEKILIYRTKFKNKKFCSGKFIHGQDADPNTYCSYIGCKYLVNRCLNWPNIFYEFYLHNIHLVPEKLRCGSLFIWKHTYFMYKYITMNTYKPDAVILLTIKFLHPLSGVLWFHHCFPMILFKFFILVSVNVLD